MKDDFPERARDGKTPTRTEVLVDQLFLGVFAIFLKQKIDESWNRASPAERDAAKLKASHHLDKYFQSEE